MRSYLATALLGLGSTTYAAIQKTCPSSNVCYSLNIPDNTASSANGDIFLQLSAPTSMSWVAVGQGSSMSGSNIFIMYTSSNGNNVTVSPRLGKGHSEPKFNSAAQITLLEGSGVSNGIMTANIKCSNCQSWSGGSMDFTSSSGSWIWAAKSGSALNSDDQSESINQHSGMGTFKFDFKQAKGGSDVNPFISTSGTASSGAAASGSGAAATTRKSCTPKSKSGSGTAAAATAAAAAGTGSASSAANGASGSSGSAGSAQTDAPAGVPSQYASYASYYASLYGISTSGAPASWQTAGPWNGNRVVERDTDNFCDDDSTSDSNQLNNVNGNGYTGGNNFNGGSAGGFSDFGSFQGQYERHQRMLIAHGVLACLAFAVFFPFGAISIRILSFPGLIWFHAAIQLLAYAMFIAAFGIGIYMATYMRLLDHYHPIIGIVLFVLLAFQPILGLLHHAMFKKYKRRTFWSYGHLWLGRIIITLGIINGGLGFLLADNTKTGPIVYGIVAGIIWIMYVAAAVYGEIKRARSAPPPYSERMSSNEMLNEGSPAGREYYGKREG